MIAGPAAALRLRPVSIRLGASGASRSMSLRWWRSVRLGTRTMATRWRALRARPVRGTRCHRRVEAVRVYL